MMEGNVQVIGSPTAFHQVCQLIDDDVSTTDTSNRLWHIRDHILDEDKGRFRVLSITQEMTHRLVGENFWY